MLRCRWHSPESSQAGIQSGYSDSRLRLHQNGADVFHHTDRAFTAACAADALQCCCAVVSIVVRMAACVIAKCTHNT
jgi:hypothetical protein